MKIKYAIANKESLLSYTRLYSEYYKFRGNIGELASYDNESYIHFISYKEAKKFLNRIKNSLMGIKTKDEKIREIKSDLRKNLKIVQLIFEE